jgi:hypothetical protein
VGEGDQDQTGLGRTPAVMPPWFVEKNIGIQGVKQDPSLSEAEIAMIAKWVDGGAPRGNPADMPKPLDFENGNKWLLGEPDLIVKSPEVVVPASGPDRWGSLGMVPTGLKEDRYVSSVEVREVNDIPIGGETKTVGGRYVFHHMTYESVAQGEAASTADAEASGTSWPIHEVGRNPDIFPPEAGRLLQKNSSLALSAYHWHSNGARPRRISSSASGSSRPDTSRSTSARRCGSATASTSTSSRSEEPGAALSDAAGAH